MDGMGPRAGGGMLGSPGGPIRLEAGGKFRLLGIGPRADGMLGSPRGPIRLEAGG